MICYNQVKRRKVGIKNGEPHVWFDHGLSYPDYGRAATCAVRVRPSITLFKFRVNIKPVKILDPEAPTILQPKCSKLGPFSINSFYFSILKFIFFRHIIYK